MRCLAPLLLVTIALTSSSFAGETSIQDALEKARLRAGGPPSDAKAKRDKAAREAAAKRAQEEKLRREREEAIREAKEAEAAKKEGTDAATAPAEKAPAAAPKVIRVFTLKDGTQIHAVMVIELQDTYALKDMDGKLREVKRDDVASIKDPD